MWKKIVILTSFILSLLAAWVGWDMYQNSQIETIASYPQDKGPNKVNELLFELQQGKEVEFEKLIPTLKYVHGRYDVSDFRLQSLTRIVYKYWDQIDSEMQRQIKDTYLNFKYWMDQPGEDGMCFWSENHQLLFATAEYLAGQRWPEEIFLNSGKTGKKHREMARSRILTWLEQRWLYGFTEWYSNVYYVEDIAPLSNLIEFAEDEEVVNKATIILDLLLHDVATQSYRGTFISTSGRMYQGNKFSGKGNSMKSVITHIWGEGRWGYTHPMRKGMDLNFILLENYEVPEVIISIGEDSSTVIIKASNGIDVHELKEEGLYGTANRQIMMQWAMEAFSHPDVIENSLNYIDQYNMLSNEFLSGFKMVNLGILRKTRLLPMISRSLNSATIGTAIQRANTYTYRTPDFMIATAQAYHPGTYGDQHHIWNATISDDLSIFTTHPGKPYTPEGNSKGTPDYWTGNGRLPHAIQHENIVLCIYQIPDKPGFMEEAVTEYTHAHFPKSSMDEVQLKENYAFGRKGDTYVAFIGKNELKYREGSDFDLIQPGKDSYWIFEASTQEKEKSFKAFVERIMSNPVVYTHRRLTYSSDGEALSVTYQGESLINDETLVTEYARFDSPYSMTERKPETITITHEGKQLSLDFYKEVRKIEEK